MDTSSNNQPDNDKPIGRPLSVTAKQDVKNGIPPAVAVFIAITVALVSFIAGTRAADYALIGDIFDSSAVDSNAELPNDLDYTSVERVYDKLRREFDGTLTEQQILDGIKVGLAESTGDPYTTYLNPDQAEQFTDDLNGTFSGIGAEIGKEGEFVIIVSPLEGFPAEAAGLKSGDIILEIDGENAVGFSIEEAVLKIRGEKGTDVMLTIFRDQEQQEITVTRDTIKVPSVTSEILDSNIGYLRISRFAEDTIGLASNAARDFVEADVKGVILDLRGNSGGFLSSSVNVSSLWIDNDVVVEQREDEGQVVTESLRAGGGTILAGVPTVVLVDKGSASASEIVAGALQDYEAAIVVGVTSFGKGSVQSLEELRDGGVLKVTIARWYTPLGVNIDETGIVPDYEVEFEADENDPEADNQLDFAISTILTDAMWEPIDPTHGDPPIMLNR